MKILSSVEDYLWSCDYTTRKIGGPDSNSWSLWTTGPQKKPYQSNFVLVKDYRKTMCIEYFHFYVIWFVVLPTYCLLLETITSTCTRFALQVFQDEHYIILNYWTCIEKPAETCNNGGKLKLVDDFFSVKRHQQKQKIGFC